MTYPQGVPKENKIIPPFLHSKNSYHSVIFTRYWYCEISFFLSSTCNQHQAVRNDRNSLSKKLTESQDETGDLKSKLKMLNHQFDQVDLSYSISVSWIVKKYFIVTLIPILSNCFWTAFMFLESKNMNVHRDIFFSRMYR